jgi:hypothetical protein
MPLFTARLTASVTFVLSGFAVAPRTAGAQVPGDVLPGAIVGVVVDSATGAPLPAAQVRLVGLARGELTHDDGGFAFDDLRPGTYTVAVQRVGYGAAVRAVSVASGARAVVRITLAASAAASPEVVVTGTLGEGAARDALRPTVAVGGAELDRRLAETIATTLQNQPAWR